jgi:LPXTG-site transpeptidase (sortase) family protein
MTILKKGVIAQAEGSAFPGDGNGKTMFFFAHSSEQGILDARENPVFYLLGNMEENDDILINYKGEIFTYKVYTKKITGAKEIYYLNYSENDKEVLILQTCWPIGTNWQRLLVFAKRI